MCDEEEDDYMSMSFLADAQEQERKAKSSVSGSLKRQRQQMKQHLQRVSEKPKKLKTRMVEQTVQGLHTEIAEDNKGFAMLAKMGFRKGDSLGKTNLGIKEPIKIQLSTGRSGIGRESQRREEQQIAQSRVEEESKQTKSDFVSRNRANFEDRRNRNDLRRAKQLLENLQAEDTTAVPNVVQHSDKGSAITEQRSYTSKPDVAESPGGNEKQKSQCPVPLSQPAEIEFVGSVVQAGAHDGAENATVEDEGSDEVMTSEEVAAALEHVLSSLRTRFTYCFYCGCSYDTQDQMEKECPGDRDEH
eukprot:GFYU01015349.1.p1 GENE.GFYU01015349.1~~GFYU01015349.1.p1  ORF type:complete len:302 (-),score=47.91 GFYU01015349.1:622-1527(-)